MAAAGCRALSSTRISSFEGLDGRKSPGATAPASSTSGEASLPLLPPAVISGTSAAASRARELCARRGAGRATLPVAGVKNGVPGPDKYITRWLTISF